MTVQLYLTSCVSWRSGGPLWLSSLKAVVRLFPLFQEVGHQDILPCVYTSKGTTSSRVQMSSCYHLHWVCSRGPWEERLCEGDPIHYDLGENKGHPTPWICHSPHKYSLKTHLNHTTQRSLALVQYTPVSIVGLALLYKTNFCFKLSRSPDWILQEDKNQGIPILFYYLFHRNSQLCVTEEVHSWIIPRWLEVATHRIGPVL